MSHSFRSAVEKLLDIQNDAKKWTTGTIHIDMATSFTDDNPKNINLSNTLGHSKYVPRRGKRDDSNCYWLSGCHPQLIRIIKIIVLNTSIRCSY